MERSSVKYPQPPQPVRRGCGRSQSGGRKQKPRLAYCSAPAKRLRYPPDIYARYGGIERVPAPHVPDLALRHPAARWWPQEWYRLLLGEPVRPALLHRAMEGRPRMHPRQPCSEVWIRSELVEDFRHLANKAHLDVRAGQRWTDKEFASPQRAIDVPQMVGEFAIDAWMQ